MSVIINQLVVLFILMAIGFALGKAKIFNQESNKTITKLILCVALPGTILSSVLENELTTTGGEIIFFLLMSLLSIALAFAIAIPAVRLLGGNKADNNLLIFMSVFSNSAFMGFPIIIALFGVAATFYASLFSFVWNIVVFSVGIMMVSGKGGKFDLKLLLNPAFITAIIAIPIALTGVQAPVFISETLRIAGSITTPGAMIVIGSILAYVPAKSIFSEWRIAPVTFIKLVLIPIATWLVFSQIITSELQLGVLVVVAAMPVAAMASMLAIEYDGNEPMASAGIFISTLLCGITVPLLVYFLLM